MQVEKRTQSTALMSEIIEYIFWLVGKQPQRSKNFTQQEVDQNAQKFIQIVGKDNITYSEKARLR